MAIEFFWLFIDIQDVNMHTAQEIFLSNTLPSAQNLVGK